MTGKNKKEKWRKSLALLVAATLMLPAGMAGAGRETTSLAAMENTYQVQPESIDGTEVVVENLTDVIKVKDFAVRNIDSDAAAINVNDTFAIDLQMPTDTNAYTQGYVRFFLVPYGGEDAAKDFADGLRYGIDYEQCTRAYGLSLESATTNSASFSSVLLNSYGLYDPPLPVIPSGAYYPAAVVYEEDVMSEAVYSKASLVLGTKPVRISNPENGGYLGDEFYGVEMEENTKYATLEVITKYGFYDAVCEETHVTVWGEDLQLCYGTAPCEVPVGEKIALSIEPKGIYEELKYAYDFPGRKNGNSLMVEVPEDGRIEVTVLPFDMGAEISGCVKDEEGNVVPGAKLSISMCTSDWISENLTSDINGSFDFRGVANGDDATIHVTAAGYLVAEKVFSRDELYSGNVIYSDIVLKAKKEAFRITFSPDIDREFAVQMANTLVSEQQLLVKNEQGDVVDGDFCYMNGYIYFYPIREKDIGGSYTIEADNAALKQSPYSVVYDGVLELAPAGTSMIKATVTKDDDALDYVYLYIVDENGKYVYGNCALQELKEGQLFLPSGKVMVYTFAKREKQAEWCSEQVTEEVMTYAGQPLEWILEEGRVIDFGELTAKSFEQMEGIDYLFRKSFMSIPCQMDFVDNSLSVNGHIEAETDQYTVQGILIYGICERGGMGIRNTDFKQGSFTVNGAVRETKSAVEIGERGIQQYAIIPVTPVEGAFDFSARLDVIQPMDMNIVVYVDAIVDGSEVQYHVGDYYVSGGTVTLETYPNSATKRVHCEGIAPVDSIVTIYDNGAIIGETRADLYGKWETIVALEEVTEGFASMHSLVAKANGASSEEISLIYDPYDAAIMGLYLVNYGERLYEDVYIWEQYPYSVEADVANPRCITGTPYFEVLCNDGTIVTLEANLRKTYYTEEGILVGNYASEEYPFGEKNLVPSQIWFEYDSQAEREKEIQSYITKLTPLQIKEPDPEIKETVHKGVLPEEEIGSDDAVIAIVTYDMSINEWNSMGKAGADYFPISGDNNELVDEVYLLDIEMGTLWGVYDHEDDSCYAVAVYYFTKDTYPESLKQYAKKIENRTNIHYVLGTSNNKTPNQNVIHEMMVIQNTEGIKENISLYGNSALEKVSDMLSDSSSPRVKNLSPYIKKVGVGEVMDIYELTSDGIKYAERDKVRTENSNVAEQMINISQFLPNGSKLEACAREVISANELSARSDNANFATKTASNIAFTGVSKGGGIFGEGMVTATKFSGIPGACSQASEGYGDADYAYAQEAYTDMLREAQKATGLTLDELLEAAKKSGDGSLSADYIRNSAQNALRRKKNSRRSRKYSAVIDPSGYIYEAVASNRVEGATVTLYGEGMEWFEAEAFGQSNPLISDSDGRYAWDVPEGNWFVKVYKAGYEENTSQNDPAATVTIDGINYLPVLPPQLDVNIGLTSVENPHASMQFADGSWYLVFDRYVEVNTVNAENISIECAQINKETNSAYSFEAADAEISPEHTPICGGKTLAKSYRIIMQGITCSEKDAMTVTVNAAVTGYNGKSASGLLQVNGGFTPGQEEPQPTDSEAPEPTETDNSDDEEVPEDNSDEMSAGIIIAIVAGVMIVLGGSVAGILIMRRKKKKE